MPIAPALRRSTSPHRTVAPRLVSTQHRGYTLLETVFAVGLAVLLMAAVVSAIEMYRRASTAGRDEVERSQIARALLRAIEADVRSCAFEPAASSDESAAQGSSGSASGSGSTSGTGSGSASGSSGGSESGSGDDVVAVAVDPNAAYAGTAYGVTGDALTLWIHALRPSRDGTGSDARVVAWFLAAPGSGGLAAAVSSAASVAGGARNGIGLARLDGDPAVVERAASTGDVETLAAQARVLAPEATAVGFRYFDGTTWLSAWDSVASQRLPDAIEVELSVGSAGAIAAPGTVGTGAPRTYRVVIDLPAAEPLAVRSATGSS